MIITRLTGGLGNQMFQYAAGLALAEQRRTVLKLDVSWFKYDPEYEAHNRYALSCFNITENFATSDEIDQLTMRPFTRIERLSASIARLFHFYRYSERYDLPGNQFYDEHFRYDPRFAEQPDWTHLHGNWQSEKYFSGIANLLRLHFSFRYPPQPAVASMQKKIQSSSSSAFIHFRRGDYVSNPDFNKTIGVLSMDYYYQAVERLKSLYPDVHFYIFSDDIDTVEREFKPAASHTFVRATQPWHSYDTLRLMSQCQHAIIANSTFSWWGAWLIPNPDKTIFAPKRWHRSIDHDCSDAVPEEWIRL